jgi:hypothetical protein
MIVRFKDNRLRIISITAYEERFHQAAANTRGLPVVQMLQENLDASLARAATPRLVKP